MKTRSMNFVLASGFAAAVAGFAPAALAQDQSGASQSTANASDNTEEVVVTAQRYEQRLQDVPISVSVLNAHALEQQSATNLEDVQFSVPGLSTYSYGPGEQILQLRGVATTQASATVGQYFNEMPIIGPAGQGNIDIRLFDMSRVEVLRGPQPTLYGEGSMGGTVHYVPAAPNLQNYSASFEAETGAVQDGEESYRANAVVNIPLATDMIGLRIGGQYERAGGWIDDLATGKKDINRDTIGTIRATLLVRPDPDTSFTLLGLHQESRADSQNFGVNRVTNSVAPEFLDDDYNLINGVFEHNFGNVDLTYSVGFIDRNFNQAFDITPFFLPALITPPPFGFGFPVGFINSIDLVGDTHQQTTTNELRLSSQHNSFFDWTLGAYARQAEQDGVVSTVTLPNPAPFVLVGSDGSRAESNSYAVFGDATFHFTPALSLLVGARYYHDHKTSRGSTTNFGLTSFDVSDGTFSTLNPRVNLSYEFSPTSLVYFNAAKGFRSGGFNAASTGGGLPVPPTYKPDSIWSYEIGTHQQFLRGRLSFDGSVYYQDWKDVISTEFLGTSAFTIFTNGGSASGYGVDLSVAYVPIDGLTLGATYGWNNVEFTTATAEKLPGDPVDFAVRQSYSASAEYRFPLLGDSHGYVRGDFAHADAAQITFRNFGGQIIPLPARNLLNARIGVDFGAYDVSLFANNALDEDKPVIQGPFGVLAEDVEARPREIGITLRAHY